MWILFYPKIKPKPGRLIGKHNGQASLEMVLSLICVFILLLGSAKVFIWANEHLILRHQDYEKTRVKAADRDSNNKEKYESDKLKNHKLDIFGANSNNN